MNFAAHTLWFVLQEYEFFQASRDIERMADYAGAHLVAKQTLQHVLIERQRVLREDGVTELLELFQDLVIESGIMVIRTAQHHDADAVLALKLVENLARLATDAAFVVRQRLVTRLRPRDRSLPATSPRIGCHACSIW